MKWAVEPLPLGRWLDPSRMPDRLLPQIGWRIVRATTAFLVGGGMVVAPIVVNAGLYALAASPANPVTAWGLVLLLFLVVAATTGLSGWMALRDLLDRTIRIELMLFVVGELLSVLVLTMLLIHYPP